MIKKYFRSKNVGDLQDGGVLEHKGGYLLKCPCRAQVIYLKEKHKCKFEKDGTLTAKPSVGYTANPELDRPENWCHLSIEHGRTTFHQDSQCPGMQELRREQARA